VPIKDSTGRGRSVPGMVHCPLGPADRVEDSASRPAGVAE
jgi:hypothetical protein